MDNKDKLLELIDNENETGLIPFLKELNSKEKKELVPIIKKEEKRLCTYQDLGERQGWGCLGTEKQMHMIRFCIFICYEKVNTRILNPWELPAPEQINKILNWYCPAWFSDYINSLSQEEFHLKISYLDVIKWTEAGYIRPTPELIVKTITSKIRSLEKYPVSLDEHIWYLFEYPSNVHWSDKYIDKKDVAEFGERQWVYTFKKHSASGRIDRMRVLRESLAAINRNFDKPLSGWFAELFILMEPINDELIQLQPELFAALSCPHSKPVNTVLGVLKRILGDPRFQTNEFITLSSILLSSEVKAVLTNTLSILDKIAKKEKDKREEICTQLVHVFLNKDEAIQAKAAKLITQYASPDSENLKMALLPYTSSILMSVRNSIQKWLGDIKNSGLSAPENVIETEKAPLIREDNRIPDIDSFEDFIFLSGQAFSNSEPYLFDQFTAALIRFAPQINPGNVSQLEPAFLQAHKVIATWTSTIGFLDRLLAASFIAYVNHLIKQFPKETQALKQLNVKYKQNTFTPGNWKSSKMWNYIPYMDLLTFVLENVIAGQTLPLLSTPTHTPGWIDPEILTKRLIQYQEAGKDPCPLDLELAIQRCALDNTEAALSLAQQSLREEYKALFIYLLSGKVENTANAFNQHYWKTALLTRRDKETYSVLKEKAGFSDKTIPDEHFTGQYNWAIQRQVKRENVYNGKAYELKNVEHKIFRISFPEYPFDINNGFFYEYCFFKYGDLSYDWGTDKARFITSYPNNYDALLSKIIQSVFLDYGPANVKTMAAIFTVIQQLNTPLSEMGCLFFACSMLHADKTVRMIAADIWLQKVNDKTVDSARIGQSIGYMIAEEFLPSKRFTDLAINNMLGIDWLHNQELFRMIEAILASLDGKKITNIKKLQEIYNELKALNN